jgi:hypothetical protein
MNRLNSIITISISDEEYASAFGRRQESAPTQEPVQRITRTLLHNEINKISIQQNEIYRQIREEREEMHKLLRVRKNEKGYGYIYPRKYWRLILQYDEEHRIYKKRDDINCSKLERLKKKKATLFYAIVKFNSKLKRVCKTEKTTLENEMCGICCDTHAITDLITTSCNHHFGICCFGQMLEHLTYSFDYSRRVNCPLCRNEKITLTRYSYKKQN